MEENMENAVNDAQEMNVESQPEPKAQTREENSAFAAMRKREQRAVTENEKMKRQNEELTQRLTELDGSMEELSSLRAFRADRIIADDIAAVLKAYPDFCKDKNDLPEDFIRIMATGAVDAVTAAEIVAAKKQKLRGTPPESMGDVNGTVSPTQEYYTPEEVDRISRETLRKTPGLMERIQKSMTKWR